MEGRNPFQGGVGFSTRQGRPQSWPGLGVAIPFRVGWGFQRSLAAAASVAQSRVAIPFRVGWGFQPSEGRVAGGPDHSSQSLSGWGGVFNQIVCLRQGK